eukprot:6739183-Pyramimonas_sp.AAC.1
MWKVGIFRSELDPCSEETCCCMLLSAASELLAAPERPSEASEASSRIGRWEPRISSVGRRPTN